MKTAHLLPLAALAALAVTGCGRSPINASSPGPTIRLGSPLAGKWVGEAKLATGNDLVKLKNALSDGKMTGPSTLTLNSDGTGFLKVAKQPEKPITWKQEGTKVVLQRDTGGAGNGSPGQPADVGDSYVATLSEDGQSMAIDMGDVKVKLTRT